MPIHLQKPRLVGFASNAAWQDLMQVADELLTDMKARAFDDDDDRELVKVKGAAEFLESFKKTIESIPMP
jgi:pyruvate-formate lyase-activating enzyme